MTKQDVEVEILDDDLVRVRFGDSEHVIEVPAVAKIRDREFLRRHVQGAWERQIRIQLQKERTLARERLLDLMGRAADRTGTVAPPAFAELVISFLAPKNSVQALLGDLHEMFRKNADRLGAREARSKYRMQVAASLLPLLWHWLKRIGFFTVLLDYFRSKLGL